MPAPSCWRGQPPRTRYYHAVARPWKSQPVWLADGPKLTWPWGRVPSIYPNTSIYNMREQRKMPRSAHAVMSARLRNMSSVNQCMALNNFVGITQSGRSATKVPGILQIVVVLLQNLWRFRLRLLRCPWRSSTCSFRERKRVTKLPTDICDGTIQSNSTTPSIQFSTF